MIWKHLIGRPDVVKEVEGVGKASLNKETLN